MYGFFVLIGWWSFFAAIFDGSVASTVPVVKTWPTAAVSNSWLGPCRACSHHWPSELQGGTGVKDAASMRQEFLILTRGKATVPRVSPPRPSPRGVHHTKDGAKGRTRRPPLALPWAPPATLHSSGGLSVAQQCSDLLPGTRQTGGGGQDRRAQSAHVSLVGLAARCCPPFASPSGRDTSCRQVWQCPAAPSHTPLGGCRIRRMRFCDNKPYMVHHCALLLASPPSRCSSLCASLPAARPAADGLYQSPEFRDNATRVHAARRRRRANLCPIHPRAPPARADRL